MRYSAVVTAKPLRIGQAFIADQFRVSDFPGTAMSPFVMVDHFRMYAPTFDEHPHAGISAVTLMLEDSTNEMLSIDSLSRVTRFGPGDLHWTLAGRGITHNQTPVGQEGVIHALQIFVNLPSHMKDIAPDSFKVPSSSVPVLERSGMRIRVIAGSYEDVASPARTPQEVVMLDVKATRRSGKFEMRLPPDANALVIPIVGAIAVGDLGVLVGQAIVCSSDASSEVLAISPRAGTQFVVLGGRNNPSPVITNGPFVYATETDLRSAEKRYRAGHFGRCPAMETYT